MAGCDGQTPRVKDLSWPELLDYATRQATAIEPEAVLSDVFSSPSVLPRPDNWSYDLPLRLDFRFRLPDKGGLTVVLREDEDISAVTIEREPDTSGYSFLGDPAEYKRIYGEKFGRIKIGPKEAGLLTWPNMANALANKPYPIIGLDLVTDIPYWRVAYTDGISSFKIRADTGEIVDK